MKSLVPPAPVDSSPRPAPLAAPAAPFGLDAGFVARLYRSIAWFGALCTLLAVYALPGDAAGVGSFVGGLALAALLLRGQEVGVRAMLQPKEKMMGMDARVAMVLLLPLKFVAVVVALIAFNALGVLRPAPLALGFFAAQLVIIAKFLGWMMKRARVSS